MGTDQQFVASTCDSLNVAESHIFDTQISVWRGSTSLGTAFPTFFQTGTGSPTGAFTSAPSSDLGECENLVCVTGSDNACGNSGLKSRASWFASMDVTYYIFVCELPFQQARTPGESLDLPYIDAYVLPQTVILGRLGHSN